MGIMDRLFKGKSQSEVIDDIVHNLGHISDCELDIASFYKLCAEMDDGNRSFWDGLVSSEEGHADIIKKMVGMIQANPKEFRPGHAFNPAAIRTFRMQIEGHVQDLKAGKVSPVKLFDMASDIEGSAVELTFMKIVETENEEFNALAKQIDTECLAHKDAIQKRSAA